MKLTESEKEWLYETMKRNDQPIENSAIFLSLYSENYEKDPVVVMQIGLAMIKDKPIYLLCKKGVEPCENMRRVANSIQYYDPNDADDLKRQTEILVETAKKHFT